MTIPVILAEIFAYDFHLHKILFESKLQCNDAPLVILTAYGTKNLYFKNLPLIIMFRRLFFVSVIGKLFSCQIMIGRQIILNRNFALPREVIDDQEDAYFFEMFYLIMKILSW